MNLLLQWCWIECNDCKLAGCTGFVLLQSCQVLVTPTSQISWACMLVVHVYEVATATAELVATAIYLDVLALLLRLGLV